MKIELGSKVKDTVTGITGIATERSEYLNGCIQYRITRPLDKKGELPDAYYVDEEQLKVISVGVSKKRKVKKVGGPMRKASTITKF